MLLKKANPNRIAIWLFPLSILGLSILIALGGDELREIFRYQDDSFANHAYWRLLTGHLAHLSWSHLFLNAVGLILVWSLFANSYTSSHWVLIFIVCCLGTSLGFYLFDKNLEWYVGLSGVLHGLIMAGVFMSLYSEFKQRSQINNFDLILLIIVIIKLMYEQIIGAVPMTEMSSGGPVIVNAHFYGAIIGTICALFFTIKDKSLSKSNT